MTFRDFQRALAEMVEEVPGEFLRGLQGVHALEETRLEPDFGEVYRLGEYLDPGPENFLGGGGGLGRHVALYYGSFAKLAEDDPDFEWEDELWETLTHELRHHVESLAGDVSLIEDDRRRDDTFRRSELGARRGLEE